MTRLRRVAGPLLLLAVSLYIVWAIPAVADHQWKWLVLVAACAAVALFGRTLAAAPGLALAVYLGEPALIVAFSLQVVLWTLPYLPPVWALRPPTKPELLVGLVNGVDAAVAEILARGAGGGPISTSTLLRVAATERPDIWGNRYRSTAVETYDGRSLRDTSGREWTSIAAESIALAQLFVDEGADAAPLQALGAAALLTPESAAWRLMRSTKDVTEAVTRATGLGAEHLAQITARFGISPVGGDAVRRIALREKIDPDGLLPPERLFTISYRWLWLATIGRPLVGVAAAVVAAASLLGKVVTAPIRGLRRARRDTPRVRTAAPSTIAASATVAAPRRPAAEVPMPQRPALPKRYRDWLRAAAAATSWPATLALRLLRPALTTGAIVSVAAADLPLWARIIGPLLLTVVRPLRRWWLDLALAAGLGALSLDAAPLGGSAATVSWLAGRPLLCAAVALALRAVATGTVVVRWGVERAVAAPRRQLPAAATGQPRDVLPMPHEARVAYLRSVEADDSSAEGVELLAAMWATADGFRLVAALVEVTRIELTGRAPGMAAGPAIMRRLRVMVIVEAVVSAVPRYAVAAGAVVTALLVAHAGALRMGPVQLPGPWLDAAAAAVLALAAARPKPRYVLVVGLAAVELWRVGADYVFTLTVVLVGMLAAQGLRVAMTRRGFNSPARLSWVGRRVTGLRHRGRLRAAASLAARGRPGIAVDVLDELVTHCGDRRRPLAAVASALCALVELDRGNLQRAVERATAARDLAGTRVGPTARAVVEFAYGAAQFEIGAYAQAKTALAAAEPWLRRRPEGDSCVSMLAQTVAVTGDVDEAIATAGRAVRGIARPGQLLAHAEAQIAAGWALLHAGRTDEARRLMGDFTRFFSGGFDSELPLDDRTWRLLWRLAGHAHLLMGRIELADGHAGAADDQLRQAAQQLRRTNAADLLGITRIYEGQCHRARDEWTQGREAVRSGLDLLEQRRGQLRLGAHRSDAIVAGRDHYDAAFDILTAADQHGDPQAGLVAAGLMESLRRSALAGMLRGGRSAFADGLSDAARATIDEIARLERELNIAAPADGAPPADEQAAQRLEELTQRLDQARAQLDIEVSRGFAEAYLPHAVDPQEMLAAAGEAHVLQFELVATGSDSWRGYRVWTPPYGQPRVEAVVVTDPAALELLRATHGNHDPNDKPFARALVVIADACAALATALLPAELVAALRARGDDPVRLIVVPGEHLAYLPWAALLLDPADEESVLLHKAVIQLVPSLGLLSGRGSAPDGVQPMLAYLDREAAINVEGPGPNAESWRRLGKALPVTRVGSRPEFEERLASDPPAGVYVMAHGVDGAGLSQGILFNDGGVLSAATALGLRWPRWMMFASCFAAKVEQRPGVEPLGLAVACMLGGCRTFVGGVIAVERVATGDIAADVSIALAAGIDPAVALRDAQLAFFAAWGAAALVDQWAGLICISTEWTRTVRDTDPSR